MTGGRKKRHGQPHVTPPPAPPLGPPDEPGVPEALDDILDGGPRTVPGPDRLEPIESEPIDNPRP